MALTIEDGSIVAGADSYIDYDDALTYGTGHPSTGATAFAALTQANQEGALRFATQWVDARYAWPGTIVDDDQTLSWPRMGAYDAEGRPISSTTIPQALIDAVCEAAFAHTSSALNEVRSRGGYVESEKVGPIEVSYFASAPPGSTYPYIDMLLAKIAGPSSPGIRTMVRG